MSFTSDISMFQLPRMLETFGVSRTSTADQTAGIQDAINSGEPILAGPGAYFVSNLTIPSYACFHGFGPGSTIFKQLGGAVGPVISLQTDHSSLIRISGFTIDGNKAGQSTPNIGLDISNTATDVVHGANSKFGLMDPRNHVRDIMILNAKGSGMRVQGKGANVFDTIWSMNCDGHAFEFNGFDSHYHNLDAGASGLSGFYFGPSCAENRFSNLKSWFSGQLDRSTYGQGFFLDGSFRNLFVNCDTQNPGSHGIQLSNASYNTWDNVRVEYPNFPAVAKYGLYLIDSSYNSFEPIVVMDPSNTGTLSYWLAMDKVGSGCAGNAITARAIQNAVNGFTIKHDVGSQPLTGNDIYMASTYHITGRQNFGYLPKYADDASAKAGGLSIGDEYIDSSLGYRRQIIA